MPVKTNFFANSKKDSKIFNFKTTVQLSPSHPKSSLPNHAIRVFWGEGKCVATAYEITNYIIPLKLFFVQKCRPTLRKAVNMHENRFNKINKSINQSINQSVS